jgi:preprotein translocase YajC subunit
MLPYWIVEVLAQGEAAAPLEGPPGGNGNPGGSGLSFLWPMAAIFLIFWLLVIRPESKKRKERQKMVSLVKKGDVVMTTGGLIARVWKADDKEVVLQIDRDKDVRVRFTKNAILEVLRTEDGEKAPSEAAVREVEERVK